MRIRFAGGSQGYESVATAWLTESDAIRSAANIAGSEFALVLTYQQHPVLLLLQN